MDDEEWQVARLIPTSGIDGAAEQRRRATSALLAVLGAVQEFARAITRAPGAPQGRVETFVEVPLGPEDARPDGLIRVTRGEQTWVALVEVRTGGDEPAAARLETLLDVARRERFDAVLTIGNQHPPLPGEHPVEVAAGRTGDVALHHLPWTQVLATAVLQKEQRGIADPEQAWLLAELIRYLEHPAAGTLEFDDMGPSWDPVREAAADGTLRPDDRGVVAVAARFDALLQFAGLTLGRRLGTDVTPVLTRQERADPALRRQALAAALTGSGRLTGGLRIPGAAAPLMITADLRAGTLTCHVALDAPRAGRPLTRVRWILRQLATAPGELRLEAFTTFGCRGTGTEAPLPAVREQPELLVADPLRELRSFRIGLDRPLGTGRRAGADAFADSVLAAIDLFHEEVLRGLEPWVAAPAPRRDPAPAAALAGQDGPLLRSAPQQRATIVAPRNGMAVPGSALMTDPGEPPLLLVDHPAERPPQRRELRVAREPGDAGDSGEPGWCRDPEDGARLRWWTGTAWSRDVHDPRG